MLSLSKVGKRIDEQDKMRRNQIINHPKYEPGFEEECRDNSKTWSGDKVMKEFLYQNK